MADAFYGLHNNKYTKNQPIENYGLRASIEILEVDEKFRISESKINLCDSYIFGGFAKS